MEFVITLSGQVRFIHDDALDLRALGRLAIRRGSHVEPNSLGRWTADLGPVGGPVLGPFDRRHSALAAEVAWLREHWLSPPVTD